MDRFEVDIGNNTVHAWGTTSFGRLYEYYAVHISMKEVREILRLDLDVDICVADDGDFLAIVKEV